MNLCDDNRIITIEKAKQAMIKGTNIENSPEEMKVLDNILFRCWQMGWLDRYDPQKKQPITEDKIKAWLDMWEGYIDADMIARMKYRVIDIRNVQLSQAATDINVGHKAAGHGSNVPMQPNIPPMPSNTSNALEALDSVNATQFNALDSISRQAAIETVMECYDNDELFEVYEDKLRELPPAFATDINVGDKDTISRKAAIDAVNCVMIMKGIRSGKSVAAEAVESVKGIIVANIRQLPPAQSETAKRIVGKSRSGMTLWYQCDMCNEPVDVQDNFCRGCGRRLIDE